jgi:uncharacterized protein (TIRG00374 family)
LRLFANLNLLSQRNKYFIKVLFTLVLLIYLIKTLKAKDLYETIVNSDFKYLFLSLILTPIFIVFKTLKWHLLVLNSGNRERYITSLKAILIGLGFGIFTPGRIGEIIRVKFYKGGDKTFLGVLFIAERLFDFLSIIFISLYFIQLNFGYSYSIIVFLFIILILLNLDKLIPFYNIIPRKVFHLDIGKYLKKINNSYNVLTPYRNTTYFLLAIFNWGIVIIQYYLIINMFNKVNFEVVVLGVPLIQMSNLIPITIGGIGVREYLSIHVLKLYGVPEQVAAISSFLVYGIDIVLPGIMGIILFNVSKRY